MLGYMQEELGLCACQVQPSWDVLREYGNLSSASVLFVLHEWITRGKSKPASGVFLLPLVPVSARRCFFCNGRDCHRVSGVARVRWPRAAPGVATFAASSARSGAPRSAQARRTAVSLDHRAPRRVLAGAALEVILLRRPFIAPLASAALLAFLLATLLRWWVIRTLGTHWNTEVVDWLLLA